MCSIECIIFTFALHFTQHIPLCGKKTTTDFWPFFFSFFRKFPYKSTRFIQWTIEDFWWFYYCLELVKGHRSHICSTAAWIMKFYLNIVFETSPWNDHYTFFEQKNYNYNSKRQRKQEEISKRNVEKGWNYRMFAIDNWMFKTLSRSK